MDTKIIEEILSKKKQLLSATYLSAYKILLIYNKSEYRMLDMNFILSEDLGDYNNLKDENEFKKIKINKRFNTIEWANGYDISPETLYFKSKPVEINEIKKAS